MKFHLLAPLALFSYTLAKPHSLARRAVGVGEACAHDSDCDAGNVCSVTSTSSPSTVCADTDVVDGSACLTGSQCASTSCSAGICDVTGGGGGGTLDDGNNCAADAECQSGFCSNSLCAQRNTGTGLDYGSYCNDNSNCKTNSACGCGDGQGTPGTCDPQGSLCLRVALGLGCLEDNDCLEYFCLGGTCVDRQTQVADGEHCNDDGNCPGAVSSSVSGSSCKCPPENPSCLGTNTKICTPPDVKVSDKIPTGEACSDSGSCYSGVCDSGSCSPLSPGNGLAGECSTDQDCLGWTNSERTSSAYCQDQLDSNLGMCRTWEIVPTENNCSDRCTLRDDSRYCDPPSTLSEEGEMCSTTADCVENLTCDGAIPNPIGLDRGILAGTCIASGTTPVATGGDCGGASQVCYSGKDQCSSFKCLPPKTLKGPSEACSATEDCATPIDGTVSCDGLTDTVGSGFCTVSNNNSGGSDTTETVTTTLQVTTTINGVVTVRPQAVTLTQRVGGGGAGSGTTRAASPVSRTASNSATTRPSSAASRSLGEVGMAVGAVGAAMVLAIL